MKTTWVIFALVLFPGISPALTQLKSGKIRALVLTSTKRSTQIPELPTVAEAGVAGFEVTGWYGLYTPAGTPPKIIGQINTAVKRISVGRDLQKRFAAIGADLTTNTPEEFSAFVRTEIKKWARVVKESGIGRIGIHEIERVAAVAERFEVQHPAQCRPCFDKSEKINARARSVSEYPDLEGLRTRFEIRAHAGDDGVLRRGWKRPEPEDQDACSAPGQLRAGIDLYLSGGEPAGAMREPHAAVS